MKQNPQTYTVCGAAMEVHRELCRLLVGIQAPRFLSQKKICENPVNLRLSHPS